MNIRTKILLLCSIAWTILTGVSFLLQFLADRLAVSSLVLQEQQNTWVFGIALLLLISALQSSKKFPTILETKWYLIHIVLSAFSYLSFNSLFIEMTTLPGESTFVQKTSSFGNALLDGILGNGFGIYALVLLLFTVIYRKNISGEVPAGAPGFTFADRIKVKLANRTYFLPKEDILFIRSANNYTDLYTEEGKHVIRQSISSLENELDPMAFMRIHRSVIIKIEEVKEFISSGNGDYKVKLRNEEIFNIGNKYKGDVIERFGL